MFLFGESGAVVDNYTHSPAGDSFQRREATIAAEEVSSITDSTPDDVHVRVGEEVDQTKCKETTW